MIDDRRGRRRANDGLHFLQIESMPGSRVRWSSGDGDKGTQRKRDLTRGQPLPRRLRGSLHAFEADHEVEFAETRRAAHIVERHDLSKTRHRVDLPLEDADGLSVL